ncbi:MAG TPA: hypothetical protein VFQ61_00380, partial [Polyangiaceae bacterium]|nr:hypothetical protein [Polyangiaceae bacterium]
MRVRRSAIASTLSLLLATQAVLAQTNGNGVGGAAGASVTPTTPGGSTPAATGGAAKSPANTSTAAGASS